MALINQVHRPSFGVAVAPLSGPWRFYYLMDPYVVKAVQKALGRNTVPKKDIHPDSFLYFTAFSAPVLLAWLLKEGQQSEPPDFDFNLVEIIRMHPLLALVVKLCDMWL